MESASPPPPDPRPVSARLEARHLRTSVRALVLAPGFVAATVATTAACVHVVADLIGDHVPPLLVLEQRVARSVPLPVGVFLIGAPFLAAVLHRVTASERWSSPPERRVAGRLLIASLLFPGYAIVQAVTALVTR